MEADIIASAAGVRLLCQDELPEPLKSLGQRYLIGLGRRGRFVPAIRLTAHSAPVWPADAVHEFIESKMREAADQENGQ